MEAYVDKLFLSTQSKKKDNTNFKTKNTPELPENQTIWKFDNQGIKEETFIQTGRRARDGQLGQRGCAARRQTRQVRWQLEDWVAPH